jgi:hypothetical protein
LRDEGGCCRLWAWEMEVAGGGGEVTDFSKSADGRLGEGRVMLGDEGGELFNDLHKVGIVGCEDEDLDLGALHVRRVALCLGVWGLGVGGWGLGVAFFGIGIRAARDMPYK